MDRSRGGGLDEIGGNMTGGGEIGSDTTSSAQLRDVGGGEIVRIGFTLYSWAHVCHPLVDSTLSLV